MCLSTADIVFMKGKGEKGVYMEANILRGGLLPLPF